jgi:hypothetical protein
MIRTRCAGLLLWVCRASRQASGIDAVLEGKFLSFRVFRFCELFTFRLAQGSKDPSTGSLSQKSGHSLHDLTAASDVFFRFT